MSKRSDRSKLKRALAPRLPSTLALGLSTTLGAALASFAGLACGDAGAECPIGAEGCACTNGGACNPGLECLSDLCVDPRPLDTSATDESGSSADSSATTGADATESTDTTTGPVLDSMVDTGDTDTAGGCTIEGCKKIDVLFAIDSSLSMIEEIQALANTAAFTQVIEKLETINCGEIDYRLGLTNDNNGGWIGFGADPWWDSSVTPAADIATQFNSAANGILGNGGTALGCEHVLSSASALLFTDTTGFLRDDALLVLVLVTDADDYGAYDQMGFGGPCDSMLCTEPFQPVSTIYNNLVTFKGGDPEGVAAIVIAGDSGNTAGMNLCQQPASCCGVGGIECSQALHATRLWEFANMHTGMNGFVGNICNGADQVPYLIEQALTNNIDLACQDFVPPG